MLVFRLMLGMYALSLLVFAGNAHALTAEQAKAIAVGETDARIEALNNAAAQGGEKLEKFLQALADDSVKIDQGRAVIVQGTMSIDAITGEAVGLSGAAEDVVSNNRMRSEIESTLAALRLFSPDKNIRRTSIRALKKDADESKVPLLERAVTTESDFDLKTELQFALAAALLNSGDREKRLAAAKALAGSKDSDTQVLLNDKINSEIDAGVKAQLEAALISVRASLAWGERFAIMFTGLSLGSILLLAALGLAITYGLMGVINMAHGELIMIGAYATFVVQGLFRSYLPQYFDLYLIAAIPIAFFTSAVVGAALERSVIRFLYGRPLETLLATWGISLILMQLVRTIFGAQNVGVENPSWMSGGITLYAGITLPWNRIFIVIFALAVLAMVAAIVSKTRLGLFVRGVTQNRPMAACMGVNTARVDTYAFALGSGTAGLAGCALSQIGNVGPDLGQNYIVDSFMVVVLGGVGQLAGTVYAAMGLGIVNKLLEGWSGAVLAKIVVLVLIIIFIQRRPQGIFALKGRSAD
jgi:urea transport system permease protein